VPAGRWGEVHPKQAPLPWRRFEPLGKQQVAKGQPRIAALTYFSLGDDAESDSRDYLLDYYGFLGDYAQGVADSALRSEDAIAQALTAYEQVGVTELFLDPTTTSLEQIDRLADVVFSR
jgi:hypothetical protein